MLNKEKFEDIPRTPGVYRFLDKNGKIIYIGKAKNLASRLSFYKEINLLTGKTERLLNESVDLNWIQTETEIESLILESDLIKKFRPKYNVSLKDDKSYSLIFVGRYGKSKEIDSYPSILLVKKKLAASGTYFGPFPDGYSMRSTLRSLRRVFPYRDCSLVKFNRYRKLGHGCLLGDLKLCPAPCIVGKINAKEYGRNLKAIKALFAGNSKKFIQSVEREMNRESEKLNFEKAHLCKVLIDKLKSVSAVNITAERYLENPNLYEDLRREELNDLESLIKPHFPQLNLNRTGSRIEAFDISNLSESGAVGAMVNFTEGVPSRNLYRRYRVKLVRGINDMAMLKEILERRFKNKELAWPDLILIDGGLPQLSVVSSVLEPFSIPYIGLAKKRERIVIGKEYLTIARNRPALKFLMRIRDEVHRFVLAYQKKTRRLSTTI